ncbi:MAG TPA: OmpA family protein [bacterium]|nr:OmpA family protein [bacterium]
MRRVVAFIAIAALCLCVGLAGGFNKAHAGLTDALKKKASDKVQQKVEEKIDQSGSDTTKAEQPQGEAKEGEGQPAAKGKGGTATSEDMTLYTKYDFVPGDKVIFYDDLAGEEIGEFPSRWKLDQGVFEVAKQGNENYIMCTDKGWIRPKLAAGPLPPKYTVEMEFYAKGPEHKGHWFHIIWVDAEDNEIANFQMEDNEHTALSVNDKQLANKILPAEVSAGKHTMRVMATTSTIKCYIDQERVANVPAVEGFAPVGFKVEMDPWKDEADNPMLIRAFRFAEGGKTLRQQLDEAGKIVTHGILFDSGSAKIKAESYRTLADIGQLLTDDPKLRLSIEGHTDSDGAEDYNLKLSQDRANAVKTYLQDTYKVDPARLEAKGWGESKPIDTNATAEGKANNRRVELVKLGPQKP